MLRAPKFTLGTGAELCSSIQILLSIGAIFPALLTLFDPLLFFGKISSSVVVVPVL
jgi:hypothetical protein